MTTHLSGFGAKHRRRIGVALALLTGIVPSAVQAQNRPVPVEEETPLVIVDPRAARTAETDAGRIGQRQTREDAARETGIEPMARISNRIANRVQNRLRSRIDRFYDPRANATSPFGVAADQAKVAGRTRR
ncbi:hypothetical protein OK349_17300 [Sphingomonas sp. BT-65]|uniref:hypothetical protein n=1 Tax=Sphingomonas sp. BT-65 TaxID=2989821 RepID=UPI0022368F03|nr:hypothetical protein [Sphingomonas sp. BT-65]MCW4463467.1 hypothetical protein [Sphingomonas sp. BT-65]